MGDVAAHALSPFSAKVAENGSPFLKKLGNHFPRAFLRLWFVPFDLSNPLMSKFIFIVLSTGKKFLENKE